MPDNTTTNVFIQTLPAILTALAGVIMAISGLVIGILTYRKASTAATQSVVNAGAIEDVHKTVNGDSIARLEAAKVVAFDAGVLAEKMRLKEVGRLKKKTGTSKRYK